MFGSLRRTGSAYWPPLDKFVRLCNHMQKVVREAYAAAQGPDVTSEFVKIVLWMLNLTDAEGTNGAVSRNLEDARPGFLVANIVCDLHFDAKGMRSGIALRPGFVTRIVKMLTSLGLVGSVSFLDTES